MPCKEIIKNTLKGRLSLCMLLCLLGRICMAQDISAHRFFSLNIQNLSTSSNLTNPNLESFPTRHNDNNFLVDASLKYPIKLRGDLKVIGTMGYERETLFGLYAPSEDEGEDFTLHSAKTSFILSYDIDPQRKFISRLSWSSNSTRLLSLDPRAASWSGTFLIEKKSARGKFGYGAIVAYSRRLNYLPLILWQKEFRNGFGIDMLLPAKVLITKKLNSISQIYTGVKAQTAGYFVEQNLGDFQNYSTNYRRTAAQAVLGYERMLNKLIGLECNVGLNLPFGSGIYSYDQKWQRLHNFNDRIAPQFKLGVFLALDRKMIH